MDEPKKLLDFLDEVDDPMILLKINQEVQGEAGEDADDVEDEKEAEEAAQEEKQKTGLKLRIRRNKEDNTAVIIEEEEKKADKVKRQNSATLQNILNNYEIDCPKTSSDWSCWKNELFHVHIADLDFAKDSPSWTDENSKDLTAYLKKLQLFVIASHRKKSGSFRNNFTDLINIQKEYLKTEGQYDEETTVFITKLWQSIVRTDKEGLQIALDLKSKALTRNLTNKFSEDWDHIQRQARKWAANLNIPNDELTSSQATELLL
jgi:hypothetical protein